MARRNQFDPLAPVDQPRWLEVQTLWRAPVDIRELPPRSDLRTALLNRLEELQAAGWQAETEVGRYASVFVRRGGERLHVMVASVPPDAPLYGPAARVWS